MSTDEMKAQERRVWILPSFPTPNGGLHVGHLAGPFIAADVLRRALQDAGRDPQLLMGTVGHQSQVAAAARLANRTFYEEADSNTTLIRGTLERFGIEPAVFVQPRNPKYPALSREVFDLLLDAGYVEYLAVPTHHCPRCAVPRFEAFLTGRCPHCSSTQTAGIECEQCALPYDEAALVDARCSVCSSETELVAIERWMLRLESLRERLRTHHDVAQSTPTLRRYLGAVLDRVLPDFPVSIPGTDGVPVPTPGAGQHVLYSGFELVGRYVTAIDAVAEKHGRGWREELRLHAGADLVVLFGFDNAYLRAVVFTAMLLALEDHGLSAPLTYLSNEFYNLDGEKFSTSRNHVVWGDDLLEDHALDDIRLYVSVTRPEIERTNFTVRELEQASERTRGNFDEWLRLLTLDVASTSIGGGSEAERDHLQESLEVAATRIGRYSSARTFNPRLLALEGLAVVDAALDAARRSVASGASDAGRWVLQLRALRLAETALSPVMPEFRNVLHASQVLPTIQIRANRWRQVSEKQDFAVDTGGFTIRLLDAEQDAEVLFRALDHSEVWTHIPSGRPTDARALRQRLELRALDPDRVQFTIMDKAGEVIGTTSLINLNPSSVEIGSTMMTPSRWGSGANSEVKQALLKVARDHIGVERVILQTDERNTRSQSAIRKLGARLVETRHADMKRADGSLRDSVVFELDLDRIPADSGKASNR
ncbi:GNAT family N-acetyltransferase [Microbacterium sp. NPDC090007]|uniref:GNAT family N-acetyltransferase n=1 Tax=Microbacterium sp. NPDC090007 TaxID=3364204 RepID=UPI003823462D